VALLDELRIERCTLVGHDVGGGIAQLLALRWPTRVARLCLIDSVAFDAWPPRAVRIARATLPMTRHLPATWLLAAVRSDLARGYTSADLGTHSIDRYLKPFATPEGRDALVEHLTGLDARETAQIADALPQLAVPTAILWGEDDPFLPVEVGRRLHAAIPRATLDVVSGARHFLPEEHPERVASVVAALLARQAS
jgi:pimeloyl-ACP methyl ester carboxylesterase